MKKLIAAATTVLAATSLFSGSPAEAQIMVIPGASLGTQISVSCYNSGGSQDVAKSPYLKNETGKTIPAGKSISWKASDGDSGSVKLSADLAPGATLKLQGTKPGNAYSCSAFFFSNPDLIPAQMALTSSTSVTVAIRNQDNFVNARSSVARLGIYSCSGSLLQTVDTPSAALSAGETRSFALTVKPVSGKIFLRVMADNTKVVAETNEQNNMADTMNSCIK